MGAQNVDVPLRLVAQAVPVGVAVPVEVVVSVSVDVSPRDADVEHRWLRYREDRSEFDEWITEFDVPPTVFDRPRAEAASLGDLVDFAIDTNNAVVESPDGTEYLVVDSEFLYAYAAPQPPEWTDGSDVEPEGDDGTDATAQTGTVADRFDGALDGFLASGGDDSETVPEQDSPADGDAAAEDSDGGRTEDLTATRLDDAALDLGIGGDVTGAEGGEQPEGGDGGAKTDDEQESSEPAPNDDEKD